ncbi:MAG: MFS transporter, partial [Planctomycetaceae bacterium]
MVHDNEVSGPQPKSSGALSSASFQGLLVTQFLGAMNDNMFRWLVVSIAGRSEVIGTAALPLGLACFTVPYLVFASFAGFLADRFSKRTVIVGCKVAEIVIMALGVVAILIGNVTMLFVVVAIMGSQSALFGPSKLGAIPELVDATLISKANGWMALTTVVASALGCIAGFSLFAFTDPDITNPGTLAELWAIPAALVGVAMAGTLTSLLIRRLSPADPQRKLTTNPLRETWSNLRLLGGNRPLLRTALGIAFFWALASLVQMNIAVFGEMELQLNEENIGPLLAILTAGVGLGSVLAGYWSGDRVELGIVPLGALGVVVFSSLLYVSGSAIDPQSTDSLHAAYVWTCVWLFFLGASAGLFNIPLAAYLQHRSERQHRGVILAGSNFVAFSMILGASGVFFLLKETLEFSASRVFLVAALGTIPILIYILVLLPGATLRFLVWMLTHTVYRVRVTGREHVPETGGALLVSNHVSWIDAVLLLVTSSRPIRMLMYADYMQSRTMRCIARLYRIISISNTGGTRELVQSLRTAQDAIQNGEL